MLQSATLLAIPEFGDMYSVFSPISEALLRIVVGVALVMHGLRMTFGFFPTTGIKVRNLNMLVGQLDQDGYRPGWLWAPLISVTQLVGGPMFVFGLFTRAVAVPIVIFLATCIYDRWRNGGYFWNKQGFEYPMLWGVAALYFLFHGGSIYSFDYLVFGRAG
jgi:putative oxidoreductase